jgi:predicted Zn finger-like uncharacterized protein
MAFAVVCKSCQSRFLLNDDLLRRKVAGKVVTVRCRQCHATIEIDASHLDAPPLPTQPAEPAPVTPAPAAPRPMALKPTPSPPRPAKSSTLIGIGSPARPAGSTELVALSPGLLNVRKQASIEAEDFPEPPPPPSVLEELDADDWEINETPPLPKADAAPESVDDFIEELPPSIPPPPGDDEPTRMLPVKAMLARADQEAKQQEAKQQEANAALGGKSTLPLFALDQSHTATVPKPPAKPRPPQPVASLTEGSLSPASLDPPFGSERPDSQRTRKNVVAPATKNEPPTSDRLRRSGLAVPIVLGLAAAAGLLIWKRGAMPTPTTTAQTEQVAPVSEKAAPAPLAVDEPGTPPSASTADDDVTFETAPATPAPKLAPATTRHETATRDASPSSLTPPKPASEPEPPAAESKPEPKERAPEPAVPSGPVGDFDPTAAAAALTSGAARASSCRKEGDPSGVASVVVTFAPSGRVTSANVSGPPFAGTATGGCIAAMLRKARVPAFEGDRVTVSKTIVIQ